MKIQHVSIGPAARAAELNAPTLAPELMASVGARYSRSNAGLDAILETINPDNEAESINRIMKYVEYGHASIADLVPLTFFIDGVSMYAAYTLFAMCPLAAGQESSTRYIKMDESSLPSPESVGISVSDAPQWREACLNQFRLYNEALEYLTPLAPDGAPKSWALDRARNLLPFATLTNLVLIQSGREWARVCRTLLSSGEVELARIGNELLRQLEIVAPNCARHGTYDEGFEEVADESWDVAKNATIRADVLPYSAVDIAIAGVEGCRTEFIKGEIIQWRRRGRYSAVNPILVNGVVRVQWPDMALAEIRDLNRHRSAVKYAPLIPQGIELAPEIDTMQNHWHCRQMFDRSRECLANGDRSAPYWMVLGVTIPFNMTMGLDKFLYMHDLRTGDGAHFRYKKHVQDAYDEFERELG